MCLVIADSLEALVATGFATFLPKFIENQFGFTSSYSATLGGNVFILFIIIYRSYLNVHYSLFYSAIQNLPLLREEGGLSTRP